MACGWAAMSFAAGLISGESGECLIQPMRRYEQLLWRPRSELQQQMQLIHRLQVRHLDEYYVVVDGWTPAMVTDSCPTTPG